MNQGKKIGRKGSGNSKRRIFRQRLALKNAANVQKHARTERNRRRIAAKPAIKKSRMIMPQLKAVQNILPQINFFSHSSKPIAEQLPGKARARS